jgi:uncharacterized Tic20 family protein
MKGNVLLFNTESGDGLINSTSDVRYKFSRKFWISDSVPKTGDRVDFVADGEFAKEICLDPDYSPQNAAGDSSGQHTRQPPPIQMGRTQEGLANLRALEDLTIPRESGPPVPNNVIKENDLPRSKLMATGFSYLLVCIISIIILFVCDSIRPQWGRGGYPTNRIALENAAAWAIFATVLYSSASLVFGIYYCTRIYKVWKSIQPFGVRTSPVAAIVFSFVPLFNLYWVFHVYYVWALNFNSKVRKFHPHLPPISTGHALTASISTIFILIITLIISPIINPTIRPSPELRLFLLLGPILFLFLVVPFLSRADRRARYLLDGLDPLPPLRSGIRRTPRQHQSSTPLIENGIDENTDRNWAMFLHLSLLLAPLVFAVTMMPVILLVGNIATIAIWQVKKGDVPGLDQHGRSVANWIISCVVYLIVLFILRYFNFFFMPEIFYVIEQGLASAIVVCYLVFPIIGGLKAKKGEVWRYPLAIPFFS